ncbi:hypothetical protein HD593_011770 [Nonomuraea rubra]|uniref:Uncharacterized protein n=1 Tax=Nonomuraea rubra TaxID=46180 RepID=A0A7X0P821_9ACTN|nr:hypothetical protein [Nonomuraea rubra]
MDIYETALDFLAETACHPPSLFTHFVEGGQRS